MLDSYNYGEPLGMEDHHITDGQLLADTYVSSDTDVWPPWAARVNLPWTEIGTSVKGAWSPGAANHWIMVSFCQDHASKVWANERRRYICCAIYRRHYICNAFAHSQYIYLPHVICLHKKIYPCKAMITHRCHYFKPCSEMDELFHFIGTMDVITVTYAWLYFGENRT